VGGSEDDLFAGVGGDVLNTVEELVVEPHRPFQVQSVVFVRLLKQRLVSIYLLAALLH